MAQSMMNSMFGEEEKRMVLYPITLLGPAKSGKTSLVYSFVQNFCPTVYVPSQDPELFYKTMDLVEVKSKEGHRFKEDVATKEDGNCMECKRQLAEEEAELGEYSDMRIGQEVEVKGTGEVWTRGRITAIEPPAKDESHKLIVLFKDGSHKEVPSSSLQQLVRPPSKQGEGAEMVMRCSSGCVCRSCWVKMREDQTFPVVVEIEDTYAWNHEIDGPDRYGNERNCEDFLHLHADRHPDQTTPAKMSTDRHNKDDPSDTKNGRERTGSDAAALFGTLTGLANAGANPQDDYLLLSKFSPPTHKDYLPMTEGRLGFMIVFDTHDANSLNVAQDIHKRLEERRKEAATPEPVVFIVANQCDRDLKSTDAMENRRLAKHYVNAAQGGGKLESLYYEEVSATELRKVKALFRKMLSKVREKQDSNAALHPGEDTGEHFLRQMTGFGAGSTTERSAAGDGGEPPKKDCVLQ